MRVNGLDALVVTKLDVLDEFPEIMAAEAYDTPEGRTTELPSAGKLGACRPVWRRFPGWRTSTREARKWEDLPAAASAYLEWIEQGCEVPIERVSVGAERESEVRRGV